MDYLGLLCLGAFVGTIVTYGMHFITNWDSAAKAMTAILAAALSGASVAFLDHFSKHTEAVGAYCVGLLIALTWLYASVALANIRSDLPSLRLLGWLHLAGVVVINLVAAALVLPPAFRQMWSIRS